MEIPVVLEPVAKGFRVSTRSPFVVSAEGATESLAMEAFSTMFQERIQNGSQILSMKTVDHASLMSHADPIVSNPLDPEYLDALAEYRREHNAVPDGD